MEKILAAEYVHGDIYVGEVFIIDPRTPEAAYAAGRMHRDANIVALIISDGVDDPSPRIYESAMERGLRGILDEVRGYPKLDGEDPI